MRPLELSIANFRSYHGDATIFDFRGRRLTGIVGPIGSGKSTILDAIAFALYGRTPTIAGATKSLIHQRSDSATVGLRFEVEGEVWQVVRSLRRKGQSQHALIRLASDDADAEELERVVLESDVTSRVEELLGLEFDAFSRSVLLAQGRFAEFLSAPPAERDKVLKGVFGHERIDTMRELAREHGRVVEADLGSLASRLDQLDRVAARLVESESAVAVLDERVERLQKAEQAFVDLEERRTNAARIESAARQRLDELTANADKLPDPERAALALGEAADAGARRIECAGRLDEAQRAVAEAEAAIEAAEQSGMQRSIDAASDLIASRAPVAARASDIEVKLEDLAEKSDLAERAVAGAAADLAAAEQVLQTCVAVASAAVVRLQAADAAARTARHLEMADALRAGLEPGHACPVCEQTVTVVPGPEGSALATAERELEDAFRHSEEAAERSAAASEANAAARDVATRATLQAEATQDELTAWRQQRIETAADLDDIDSQLVAALGDGDAVDLLETARSQLRALGSAAAEARKAAERARSAHDEAILAEQSAGKQVAELRMAIADASGRLGVSSAVAEGIEDVRGALDVITVAWNETLESLRAEIETRSAEIASIESDKRELEADLGIERDIATDLGAASAKAEMIREQIAADRDEIEAASDLADERERLASLHAGYERIAADLTNAGFIRFLLDDERARLSDLGSEHFQRLSSGRYRFTDEGRFDVVDLTAADAVRKADSLSGGETFVASLALALALAEMVSGIGGRLDAFFIDEGFGSLDPEHLDLAMEGIESLAAGEGTRLVVVVSHVPEMRQRIEDLIELDRDPVTGDTKVVSGLAAS